jgi:hypothetical protein
LNDSLSAIFTWQKLLFLQKVADVKVEKYHVQRMDRKTDVVELSSVFVPSEFYQVAYDFAFEDFYLDCFSTGIHQAVFKFIDGR